MQIILCIIAASTSGLQAPVRKQSPAGGLNNNRPINLVELSDDEDDDLLFPKVKL